MDPLAELKQTFFQECDELLGALEQKLQALDEGFDMIFTIGTTAFFPYIAQPVVWAVQAGIPTVEINPDETRLSRHVDYRLPLGAAEAMAAIMAQLNSPAG